MLPTQSQISKGERQQALYNLFAAYLHTMPLEELIDSVEQARRDAQLRYVVLYGTLCSYYLSRAERLDGSHLRTFALELKEQLAQTLEREKLEPQLLDLKQTDQKQWPSLASYDGLLVGSGIRIARWTREATKYLKKHADEIMTLKSKGLVVGVFVSCGMASTPGQQEEARQKYVEKILGDIGVSDAVDAYEAFGRVYDRLRRQR